MAPHLLREYRNTVYAMLLKPIHCAVYIFQSRHPMARDGKVMVWTRTTRHQAPNLGKIPDCVTTFLGTDIPSRE